MPDPDRAPAPVLLVALRQQRKSPRPVARELPAGGDPQSGQQILVGAGVRISTFASFRREPGSSVGIRAEIDRIRPARVEQQREFTVPQHRGRGQVAVHDAAGMQLVEGVRHLHQTSQTLLVGH